MPFCETCGTEHADEDRFCTACGNVLPGAPAAPARSVATSPGDAAPAGRFPTALVAIAAVIVVALIAVAFLVLRGDGDEATATTANAAPTESASDGAAQSSLDEAESGNRTGGGTGAGTGAGTGGGTGGGRNRTANDEVQDTATADGLTLRHPAGVSVEVPAGVLPEGAAATIQPTEPPELPDGIEPVGDFYKITTSVDLTGLATLRLPIPRGAATDELALYQLQADGHVVSYEGRLEGGFYVADLA